jgi:hypothetical protein
MKLPADILERVREADQIGDPLTPFDDPWREFDFNEIIDFSELHWPWWLFCKAPNCGKPFIAGKRNQKYCSRKCTTNATRDERRAQHEMQFIGIDGEGVNVLNDAGEIVEHDYVLLCANGIDTEPLFLHRNGARLTTLEILKWLYCIVFARHPDACFVTFAMGYDLSQWLKNLPKSRARGLFVKDEIQKRQRTKSGGNTTPFPVRWRDPERPSREWELDTLGTKRFKLRLCETPYRDYSGRELENATNKRPSWMYICDVFSYFQQSFVKAIDPEPRIKAGTASIVTPEEYEIIREGKSRREDARFDEAMMQYNALECKVLARLMKELDRGMVENDVRLRRDKYIGPGQTAQAAMDVIIKTSDTDFTRKNIEAKVPLEFRDRARQSYFGGWFEIMKHGMHEGTAYEYDINSAYPKVMTQLPCLLHGNHLHGEGDPYRASRLRQYRNSGFGLSPGQILCLVDASVVGLHPRIGAMLHRRARSGRVSRPHMTEGWYWLHELEAAKRAGLIDTIDWHQWHAYVPCDCPKPLHSLEDMYLKRLQVGKNTPSGIALKLMYNSCYGKFAQSIGAPKYANPVYASLITAGCRCLILDAIATHQDGAESVLMVATDGIYFTAPHHIIDPDPVALGCWTLTERENLMLFKPGTYWDDDVRAKLRAGDLEKIKFKSRGVNMAALARGLLDLDEQFAAMKPGDKWPSLPVTIPFQVISPQQALARNKWHLCGSVSNTRTINISADPSSKRVADQPGWSRPPLMHNPIRSAPYTETFGDETLESLLVDRPLTDNLHPDGQLVMQLSELFLGDKVDVGAI